MCRTGRVGRINLARMATSNDCRGRRSWFASAHIAGGVRVPLYLTELAGTWSPRTNDTGHINQAATEAG
jgi:hypothetical protein